MNTLKRILVATDFSDCSRSALEQAVRLAKGNHAHLHALHTVEYLTLSDTAWASHIPHEQLERKAVAEAHQRLQRWLAQAGADPEAQVLMDVGAPIDCVLRRVRETKANLLVLGVTGSSMIPMGAGTLATKCLRKAPTKVMLVREGHTGAFRKIVAGVDFSEQSREALTQALQVAAQDESELHLLHVFTGSWGRHALVPDAWEVNEETAVQYRRALELRLREFAGDTAGRPTRFAVVEAANHGHGIAEYARRVGADLVVLGTKGRSNLGYVLLGSTVERLLRELPCSALVIRSPGGMAQSPSTKRTTPRLADEPVPGA
jgi:nucleotide-binding universal stress UspA family protein